MNRRDALVLGGAASLVIVARHAIAQDGPLRLLLVHGRGQGGLKASEIQAEWLASLSRGADKSGLRLASTGNVLFPFYGDTLDRLVKETQVPLTTDIQTRGASQDDDFLTFQHAVAEEIRTRANISDAMVNAEYGADPRDRGPLNWRWVQAILRAIDKHGPGIREATLEQFTRDVYVYLTFPAAQRAIDTMVRAALNDQPTVVVSHSLGTVVAYNVLSARNAAKVPLFVTIGSPLAVRAIRDRLGPIRSPSPVSAWYNAYDPRDVVSLYPLDRSNFDVEPPIENNGRVSNPSENRHAATGYLDDSEVSARIVRAVAPS